jgi:hypothetical protein
MQACPKRPTSLGAAASYSKRKRCISLRRMILLGITLVGSTVSLLLDPTKEGKLMV